MITLTATPVLETERLILRAPQADDLAPYAAFYASERAGFVGGPLTEDLAWRGFGHAIGHWVLRGYGMFIVVDKASEKAIGMVGPWNPATWPEAELGWSLWDPAFEGKGFAREAVIAARNYAYTQLGWTTAISLIAPENAASAALAARLGAQPERDWELRGKTVTIWRHPSAESLAAVGDQTRV